MGLEFQTLATTLSVGAELGLAQLHLHNSMITPSGCCSFWARINSLFRSVCMSSSRNLKVLKQTTMLAKLRFGQRKRWRELRLLQFVTFAGLGAEALG